LPYIAYCPQDLIDYPSDHGIRRKQFFQAETNLNLFEIFNPTKASK